MAGSGGPVRRLPAPPWVLVAAAVVAAVAGLLAVVTTAEALAVLAGAASVVTAALAVAGGRPVRPPAPPTPEPAAEREPLPVRADAIEASAAADLDDDPAADPMRSLFESGPPAGSTSLLHAEFLATTLRGRVAVARRALRPLSVICFECFETRDGRPTQSLPHDAVGAFLKRTLREADVSGRSGDAFVCILEDTGEDGAVWTAERVRRTLLEEGQNRRFRAGIASYPTHGLDAEELLDKAHAALAAARDWGSDRIEVATAT